MTQSWKELSSSERWFGVVSFIRNWVGQFGSEHGISPSELDTILQSKTFLLPTVIREWYLLAANWSESVTNVWNHPRDLVAAGGTVCVLSDKEGVNNWGVRVADFQLEDPPVFTDLNCTQVASPSFSQFVAAMIVNDIIFDYESEPPLELKRDSPQAQGLRLAASCCGNFYTDNSLETAEVVIYAYPNDGPVFGKSRTEVGRNWLHRFRLGPD